MVQSDARLIVNRLKINRIIKSNIIAFNKRLILSIITTIRHGVGMININFTFE